MSKSWNPCLIGVFIYLIDFGTVKNWSGKFASQFLSCPTQHSFINLTDVHTRWYTQWVQYNFYRSSIIKERHIFLANDTGHNTFVTVTARHFVPNFQFSLFSDVNLRQFQYSGRKFISNRDCKFLTS